MKELAIIIIATTNAKYECIDHVHFTMYFYCRGGLFKLQLYLFHDLFPSGLIVMVSGCKCKGCNHLIQRMCRIGLNLGSWKTSGTVSNETFVYAYSGN